MLQLLWLGTMRPTRFRAEPHGAPDQLEADLTDIPLLHHGTTEFNCKAAIIQGPSNTLTPLEAQYLWKPPLPGWALCQDLDHYKHR